MMDGGVAAGKADLVRLTTLPPLPHQVSTQNHDFTDTSKSELNELSKTAELNTHNETDPRNSRPFAGGTGIVTPHPGPVKRDPHAYWTLSTFLHRPSSR